RIYVADLAAYNAGTLHGVWIDVDGTTDVDEIQEQIAEMLRDSPNPNVMVPCPECGGTGTDGYSHLLPESPFCSGECAHCHGEGEVPSAEEYAIHDYDDDHGLNLGEHPDLENVCLHGRMLDEHGEAWSAYVDHVGDSYATEDGFQDAYAGEWSDAEEYAADYLESTGSLDSMPDSLQGYFDYAAFARDLQYGGDMYFADLPNGNVAAFYSR